MINAHTLYVFSSYLRLISLLMFRKSFDYATKVRHDKSFFWHKTSYFVNRNAPLTYLKSNDQAYQTLFRTIFYPCMGSLSLISHKNDITANNSYHWPHYLIFSFLVKNTVILELLKRHSKSLLWVLFINVFTQNSHNIHP